MLAAAAAAADVVVVAGMDADTDFDIAAGEDDIEPMEEVAGLAAGWQRVLAEAAVGGADGGGEPEQVDWKMLRWKPVAGAGGADDGMGHVWGVGYVVDVVELGEGAVVGIAEVAECEIASKDFEVVVHGQVVVVVQVRGRN